MDATELLDIIQDGEVGRVQFKETLPQAESMCREIVAMSNSIGGIILLGIKDKSNDIIGLSPEQIEYADRKIAEYADSLKPTVYVATEVVKIMESGAPKRVLVVHVPEGINKPYKTPQGEIYIKQGSNKRLMTENSEIMRLFQQSGNLTADEMPVYDTTIEDINEQCFSEYFQKEFKESFQAKGLTYEKALRAKKVLADGRVTLAGLLFFGKTPQNSKPAFTIKAVSFFGNDLAETMYRSKPEDFKGTVPMLFKQGMDFLKSNLRHVQRGQNFNSIGILEISETALIEVLQNAMIHRDYFKNAPVRLFIFDDRVEIISPGKLPNGLTVEEIKYGNAVIRNNQMAMFSSYLLPYSGLGSGLKRAVKEQPNIEFINDENGEQFIVKIPREPMT
ncbi:MAG: putative DNA binding domain-containing protein [Bacteroidales bacterium]|jgi:predicted HTH transcriptional regulator|nr:putative DNA binding domain-containing protein [Bacteroidales bacterium]